MTNSSTQLMDIATRIRGMREILGYSSQKMAAKTEVTEKVITNISNTDVSFLKIDFISENFLSSHLLGSVYSEDVKYISDNST